MDFPKDLLFTKDHEWARVETDGTVTIGITEHAQEALGEIVFVELPKNGRELKSHDTFGVVESIKAVSDLYSPVAGTVIDTNQSASADPGLVNRSVYGDGWLIKVKVSDKSSLEGLLNASQYRAYVESLK